MNLLVVRLGALGDVVHTIPAVAAVRKAFPDARIDWLVDRKHRAIVDLVTVVDRVIALEQGSLIADGPLSAVVRDERVLRTYLGSAGPAGTAPVLPGAIAGAA